MHAQTQKTPRDYDRLVGSRIHARRTALGISQSVLGQAIGVTFQQVQKYEKGANRISVGRLEQIASALGVTSLLLMGGPANTDSDITALLSNETKAMVEAFDAIGDRKLRRALLSLARALSESVGR